MQNTKVLTNLHYLPCLAWFENILSCENFVVDLSENYQKQSYRNRTEMLTSQGKMPLSVPVLHAHSLEKTSYLKATIDNSQQWQRNHWRSIVTAYKKAPFFMYYEESFEKIYQQKFDFLWEWNKILLENCLKILKIPQEKISYIFSEQELTSFLVQNPEIINQKEIFSPKKEIQKDFKTYIQVFGEDFVKNLSVLDLIFCEGNNSKNYL